MLLRYATVCSVAIRPCSHVLMSVGIPPGIYVPIYANVNLCRFFCVDINSVPVEKSDLETVDTGRGISFHYW